MESAHCAETGPEIVPDLRHTPAMNTTAETTVHDRILAERARYVSAGVSTPKLVVAQRTAPA